MRIAKIRGIDIKLHASTLFIVLMVGFGAGQFYRGIVGAAASITETILFGLVSGLLILFSMLIHEIMHSITGQK